MIGWLGRLTLGYWVRSIKLIDMLRDKKNEILDFGVTSLGLGSVIQQLRKAAGISQEELGRLIHVHQTAVCRIERNQQSLSPEQLFILSKHFDIKLDSLFAGRIDFSKIALRFDQPLPFPKRYRKHLNSKVREVLPILYFASEIKGPGFLKDLLHEHSLNEALFINPDMQIGANVKLDLLRYLLSHQILDQVNFAELIDQTRKKHIHGFLDPVYQTQTAALPLLQLWILNSHHYDTNFKYSIEDLSSNQLDLSISPNDHMKDLNYKDELFGDFLCRYTKTFLSHFPQYIQKNSLLVRESECHYRGAKQCIYTMSVA